MTKFYYSAFASVAVLALNSATSVAQSVSDIGNINIVSQDNLAMGLMEVDDGVKARSSINSTVIENNRPGPGIYNQINLLPGVNAYNIDATGMWGGNIRIRGFDSSQMGFTVNGVPVNDSGNFAVYPQEYADTENLCEIFVTQGSVDSDAPHVGASGGNIGLTTCAPKDQMGGKAAQTFGQLAFNRSFVRFDSGLMGESKPGKFFLSYSHGYAEKFKGYGEAIRDHVAFGSEWKILSDTKFTQNFAYNQQKNHFYSTLTKSVFEGRSTGTDGIAGPSSDYRLTPPSVVNGSAAANNSYYGYFINPFRNVVYNAKISNRVDDKLTVSFEPYYWWGYGNGGGTTVLDPTTSSALNGGHGTIVNPYDKSSSKFLAYTPSVTKTQRPGFYLKANWNLEKHNLLAGVWFEKANHRQTKPGMTTNTQGDVSDLYGTQPGVFYTDGTPYQGRNYQTTSTAYSYFLNDTYFVNNRFDLIGAIRYSGINRDLTNYASSASATSPLIANFSNNVSYGKVLPSIGARYKLDSNNQLFGNVTQNMKAPANFVQADLGTKPNNLQAETSTVFETGHRYNGEKFNTSATVFLVDFQNRLANGYNPDTQTYTSYNLGASQSFGLEAQIGTKPINGFSYYGSATLMKSMIKDDFKTTLSACTSSCAILTIPTSGNAVPDTPNVMFANAIQYSKGPYLMGLTGKFTGVRYTTLLNDESLDPYFTVDLNAAYRFQPSAFLKTPTLRLNATNILNASYQVANVGSGSSIAAATNSSKGSVYSTYGGYSSSLSYYNAAPSFVSMTFSSDF
jgi:iron complex outermembrane receptor protein